MFFEANQVDGQLSDAQMMTMLSLPQGDSSQEQTVSVPDADAAPKKPETEVEVTEVVEAKPVILAKDGVHTIEYEKLVEAREAEKHWRQVALEAQTQLEQAKAKPVEQEQPAAVEETDLFGDYSEAAIAKGFGKLVAEKTAEIEAKFAEKLNAVLAPLQAKQAQSAEAAHFAAIAAAHPDVDSIAQSAQLEQWINSQPSFVRDGYKAVIAQGTAEQVIEALNTFKAATGKQTATAPAKPSVEAAAKAAIAKAKSAPPMSLSEIPAGTNAVLDESAAMLEMSSVGQISKFEGKSPEQIMALMNRVL